MRCSISRLFHFLLCTFEKRAFSGAIFTSWYKYFGGGREGGMWGWGELIVEERRVVNRTQPKVRHCA